MSIGCADPHLWVRDSQLGKRHLGSVLVALVATAGCSGPAPTTLRHGGAVLPMGLTENQAHISNQGCPVIELLIPGRCRAFNTCARFHMQFRFPSAGLTVACPWLWAVPACKRKTACR